jgi:DNA-binding NarL/FixJ family response regulator
MDRPRHHPTLNPRITVMLVDDDLLVRTTASDLLGRHRDLAVIGVFADGHDALLAAATSPPDVMVVDISMPAMSGSELTRRVREQHPATHVLAYTSLADEQSLSEMLNAGAAGVVYKEASVGSVADAIRATHVGLSVLSPRFSSRLARPELEEPLTDTETDILRLVSRGMTNEQIGDHINLSPSTVKYHITKLTERLGANNRVTLAVAAVHLGLVGRSQAERRPRPGPSPTTRPD